MNINIEKIENLILELDELICSKPLENIDYNGIIEGKLGLAYYSTYMLNKFNQDRHLEQIENILDCIFEKINVGGFLIGNSPTLSAGLSGFGWVLNVLIEKKILDSRYLIQIKELDDFLISSLDSYLNQGKLDYLHGAFGILNYLYERRDEKINKTIVPEILAKLYKYGKKDEYGIRFYNTIESEYTQGYVFCISHGQIGYLMVLLKFYSIGVEKNLIKEIVSENIRYMLSNKRDPEPTKSESLFPLKIEESVSGNTSSRTVQFGSRIAWCHGDLNMLLLLYRAGNLFNDPNFTVIAQKAARYTCNRRIVENTGIIDPHFCHGSAGTAQFYLRLSQLSREKCFYEAYEYWIWQTITFLDYPKHKINNSSILQGLPGINLTLLSYLDHSLDWDKLFLIS